MTRASASSPQAARENKLHNGLARGGTCAHSGAAPTMQPKWQIKELKDRRK